jgi:acyl dehydratase
MEMAEHPARYFEDYPLAFAFETAACTVTAQAIVAFAAAYDPQPFHLDPEAAKTSVFHRLVASGWHTAAVTMRLLVETGIFAATGLVGLGVDELRWPRPVDPGDTIRARAEVVNVKPSRSGSRGTVRWAVTSYNQRDEVVLSMTTLTLFPMRSALP